MPIFPTPTQVIANGTVMAASTALAFTLLGDRIDWTFFGADDKDTTFVATSAPSGGPKSGVFRTDVTNKDRYRFALADLNEDDDVDMGWVPDIDTGAVQAEARIDGTVDDNASGDPEAVARNDDPFLNDDELLLAETENEDEDLLAGGGSGGSGGSGGGGGSSGSGGSGGSGSGGSGGSSGSGGSGGSGGGTQVADGGDTGSGGDGGSGGGDDGGSGGGGSLPPLINNQDPFSGPGGGGDDDELLLALADQTIEDIGGPQSATAIPEPASAGLLAAGLFGLALARRRRGKTKR